MTAFTASIAQTLYAVITKTSLISILLFVIGAHFLNRSGLSQRFADLFSLILAKLPGSLMITNTLLNTFFGSLCGSASAAAAATGSMLLPRQRQLNYRRSLCAANNAASAPAGLLIAPSYALITYSLASGGLSVASLFAASYFPGLLWMGLVILCGIGFSIRYGYTTTRRIRRSHFFTLFRRCVPVVLLIGVIALMLSRTWLTLNEASAVFALGSVLLYIRQRGWNYRMIRKIFLESAKVAGSIVFLFGTASIIGWILEFFKVSESLFSFLESLDLNFVLFILLINIVLLIAGAFIDIGLAILIFTPMLLPVVTYYGMDPLQFGVMLVYNLSLGNITPPAGDSFLVAIKVANSSLSETLHYLLHYYGYLIVGLLMVSYLPFLSLWLPQTLGLI